MSPSICSDKWQICGPYQCCDENSLRGKMHNHKENSCSVGDERAGSMHGVTIRLNGVKR